MNSSRFDHALLRLLLIAAPFSCGGKTFYEPAPSARCGAVRVVPSSNGATDGDGGTSSDGGLADAGTSPVNIDGGTTLAPYSDAWCARVCGDTYSCQATLTASGQPAVACESNCNYGVGCGRRPAGLPPFQSTDADALQAYFDRAAYLEQASVTAFRRLAVELAMHGAPDPLVSGALVAACEEEDHAAAMRYLARRARGEGHERALPTAPACPSEELDMPRALSEIARENMVEGCVRELLGALIACYQAENAQDPEIRSRLQAIAREETGHARLSFAVAEWADGVLDSEERAQVRAARTQAIAELSIEVSQSVPVSMQQAAGWPPVALMQAWVNEAQQSLWI